MKAVYLKAALHIFLLGFVLSNAYPQGEAEGTKGMVATAHPLASEAAIEMLQGGGNAVDAAIAAAFAIGVVEPDGSGLGGGGGMVIYLKEKNESFYINYYARASERGSEAGYSGSKDAKTAKAICVPGTVAGLTMAHEKFGTLPLKKILEPAIRYASAGFTVDATLATLILDNIETVYADEVTTNVFCVDGFPLMEGDRIIQKELAETLSVISREGKRGFYEGVVAESMVKGIAERGGTLTMNDFMSYEAELTVPLHGTYRGYDILTANVPQSGLCLIEALNILENYDLKSAPHYSESATILHLIAETERFTYADRTAYLGDPNENVIPVSGLISKKYAKKRFQQINREQLDPPAYRDVVEGDPFPYVKKKTGKTKQEETTDSGGHTTHLSVIDKDGNSVALTQTLGLFFGSGQTVEGVLMNCAMTNFSHRSKNSVNFYKDGKQSRSSIMPTIILKDEHPFLIAGSPGAARIIATLIEVIINVIDYEMSVTEANLAPRFFVRDSEDYLYLESGIRPDVRQELTEMGHTLKVYQGIDLFFGGAQMIYVDPADGTYYGSADKRRGGIAIGY
ncbi:MAG: gamma-glutamyltransferase [Bacteroidales bacterium]|nr:gamma-glutamyltransferase [Bacteroidales bacterium]